MYVCAIEGGDEDLLSAILAELDGQVAVIRTIANDGATVSVQADTEYRVNTAGWEVTGATPSIHQILDDLAVTHDYAIIQGDAPVPTMVLNSTVEQHNPAEIGYSGPGSEKAVLYATNRSEFDVHEALARLHKTEPHETLESLIATVKQSNVADRAGAIATFTGRVRAKDSTDDNRTQYLEFEKYEEIAEKKLREIESELSNREGVFEVLMHHRTGNIPEGEDIVFVVVLAGHREEAFRTVEDGINRLKAEVPIFKKEVTDSDTFWVHNRP